jgi:general secretion pathway protein A
MYESFYGLRERPFDLTPNARFLLLTGKHREALSNLQYGLTSRRGLTVLVGEAGTGKTTLVRATVNALQDQGAIIGYLNNPTLSRPEFLEFLCGAFHLMPAAQRSKVSLLAELAAMVEKRHSEGILTALVIDEAQSLPDELLEEVRLLANIETPTEKLLPVVLAGQPELADRLNQVSLRQLKQRVALRCQLEPLDAKETGEYVSGRIRIAGGNSSTTFTRQAVDAIYEHSGGIPRLISVICDNALISGFAADRRPVGLDIVQDVCRDFDLPRRVAIPAAAPAVEAPRPTLTVMKTPPKATPAAPAAEAGKPAAAAHAKPAKPADDGGRALFQHFSVRRRFSFFSF